MKKEIEKRKSLCLARGCKTKAEKGQHFFESLRMFY